MARRCLIIACSQRKREDVAPLPAFQRYDGPAFRVLRKFLAEADSALQDVDICVLSAAHGLIVGDKPIANYDQRMTEIRAEALRPQTMARLSELLASGQYSEIFLSLSRDYLRALEGYETIVPTGVRVVVSQAASGKRLTELKRWLYRLSEEEGTRREAPPQQVVLLSGTMGRATIRGHTITASPDEVLAIAREALAAGHGEPQRFRSWYVLVAERGQRVGVKWLVSMLTGLPPSAFDASEARRVLRQLGMMVYRDD